MQYECAVEYNVGPNELGASFDGSKYAWVIAWYEQGDYDGSGTGAALRKDGIVEYSGLGHCSCYGPTDDWDSNCSEVGLLEFLTFAKFDQDVPGKERTPQDYDFSVWQAIIAKAMETEEVKAALSLAAEVERQEGLKLFN